MGKRRQGRGPRSRVVVSGSVKPRVADALDRYAEDCEETRSRVIEELAEEALVNRGYLPERRRRRR